MQVLAFAPLSGVRVVSAARPSALSSKSAPLTTTKRHVAPHNGRGRSAVLSVRAMATDGIKESDYSNETKMRAEATAPFRVARMFFYGSCGLSCSIGTGIASLQAITKVLGAPNSPPLDQSLQNLAVNVTCLALFVFLYKKDDEAKLAQMARIGREERLGRLKVSLSSGGKIVRLEELRGFSRVCIVAGDIDYCREAVERANALKEPLEERGVLVIPVVVGDGLLDAPAEEDRRFRAAPMVIEKWQGWVKEQKDMANVGDDKGVYVGLRMDGRVRSSGVGPPPWERFAAELPPTESWGGMLDGFDGRVGVDN